MEIFGLISSTVMQIFHTKGQLSIANYRAQAKRHSTGNKLCYNQVFQVYMALHLWVMKWVKRKQSTIVLTSSPPPPNPKQTLPPIFHSLSLTSAWKNRSVGHKGGAAVQETDLHFLSWWTLSQPDHIRDCPHQIMKPMQGSSPNKP